MNIDAYKKWNIGRTYILDGLLYHSGFLQAKGGDDEYHSSGDSEGLWLVDGCHHYLADVNGCAWMPLPEPYVESEIEE